MPIRMYDPFIDPTANLNPEVNPFLGKMREGLKSGDLPLLFGPDLKGKAGNWRQYFAEKKGTSSSSGSSSGLILEIGCHKGETIRKMACDFRDLNFMGIDITFKRVVNTAEKAAQSELKNVVSVLCNGRGLHHILAPEELDGVIIFFPDPWANKKRQKKNRLLSAEFFEKLKRNIRKGGFLWIKTDNWDYASEIQEHAKKAGFERCENRESLDVPLPTRVYTSRFERHFQEQGLETFDGCWVL